MTKSYKEMNYKELLEEEQRVKEILIINDSKNKFTSKQNVKYLKKIQTELRMFEINMYGKAITMFGVR